MVTYHVHRQQRSFYLLTTLPISLSALVFLLSAALDKVAAETFIMGYMTGSQRSPGDLEYSRPGRLISGAINLAVEDINRRHPLVNGHQLGFIVAETFGVEHESVAATVRLYNRNVSAIIGPQDTCVHEAMMASSLRLAMISYFCTNYETSDKRQFSTFVRTRPPDTHVSKSVLSVLKRFSWSKVALISKLQTGTEYAAIGQTIGKVLTSGGVTLTYVQHWNGSYHEGYMDNPFIKILQASRHFTRVYVVLGEYFELRAFLVTMKQLGMLKRGEYFVVGVDIEQYKSDTPEKYLRTLFKAEEITSPEAAEVFRHYLGVIGSPAVGFSQFRQLVNVYMEKPPFNYSNVLRSVGGSLKVRSEAGYLYDAVMLYAWSLNETLKTGQDPRDGNIIVNRMLNRSYHSAMGYLVYMDSNGDAEGNYSLISLRFVDGKAGLYPIGVFQIQQNHSQLPGLVLSGPIVWPLGRPPLDEPLCGFNGEHCISYHVEIGAGVTSAVLLVASIFVIVIYRNWRYEQELDLLLWKIDFRELEFHDLPSRIPCSDDVVTKTALLSSQMSLTSNYETGGFRMDWTGGFGNSGLQSGVARYRGRLVTIKLIQRQSVDVTRSVKKLLKAVRDLRHDNINPFIGACLETPHFCVVSDYCNRGSIREILDKGEVNLDNMFLASMIFDIIRGMGYLHDSPVRCHGNLRTTTCLVDSRWSVKLSDFGIAGLFHSASKQLPYKLNTDALFYAPEILREYFCKNSPVIDCGTPKSDVYSFSMVLYELLTKHPPFHGATLNASDLVKALLKSSENGIFRPPLPVLDSALDSAVSILAECWAENPESRPDFRAIRHGLRPLRRGLKPHIFDNMIALMEKYTNNLEMLVDERTDQLKTEKRRIEDLLDEMLPRYVADQLKMGHSVQAESFSSVTIYFSDIVGFTTMSAQSTPLQVVDFLNDLYTCFDSILGNYDVYKVETIGDAYMVASGLPVRNGLNHAGEIASMSLRLLEAVGSFRIRHRPQDSLLLRVGIHTGGVCAGVVGRKMPRYCLFGDTVNTASRMESTGQPLRIHCSDACKQLLDKIGGFQLQTRGHIEVKGKGPMVTHWLVGETTRRTNHTSSNVIVQGSVADADQRRGSMLRACSLESRLYNDLSRGDRVSDLSRSDRVIDRVQLSAAHFQRPLPAPVLRCLCASDLQLRRSLPSVESYKIPPAQLLSSGSCDQLVVPTAAAIESGSLSDSALNRTSYDVTENEPLLKTSHENVLRSNSITEAS